MDFDQLQNLSFQMPHKNQPASLWNIALFIKESFIVFIDFGWKWGLIKKIFVKQIQSLKGDKSKRTRKIVENCKETYNKRLWSKLDFIHIELKK